MPKCTESWDNCSGFFSCTGALFETAAKCSASAAEDVADFAASWAKGINDQKRQECYDKTVCIWETYKAGKTKKRQMLNSGFGVVALKAYELAGGNPKDGLKMLAWVDSTWEPTYQDYQSALTVCGQSYSNTWVKEVGVNVLSAFVGLASGTGAKGYAVSSGILNAGFELVEADTGPCGKGYSKLAGEVSKAAGQYAAATGKEGVKEVAIIAGKGASVKGGAVLADTLKELGIELPPEVLNVLACIEKSAGTGAVALAAFDAVSGNAEKAAKSLAPYVVNCVGQEALAKLGPGPVQSVLKKALQLATAIAFQPPPPPPPKPVLDCSSAGFEAYANAGDKASLVACYGTQGLYGEQASLLADLYINTNKLAPSQLAKASWLGDLSKVDLPKRQTTPPPPTPVETVAGIAVAAVLLRLAVVGG